MAADSDRIKVSALRVNQWAPGWDSAVVFDERQHTRKPDKHFFMFSMPANQLRKLCGIQRRSADTLQSRASDMGIQRRHNAERSEEIQEFVEFGFPWSSLSASQRRSGTFDALKKPGWLPTAVIVNILKPEDDRNGKRVALGDAIRVEKSGSSFSLSVPDATQNWEPSGLWPMEVVDGQHRLWSFTGTDPIGDEFELPVVAFYGLDVSWQAYLFYTINIKPKKINTSLAYDLYPLLRTEQWLSQVDGPLIYNETRAQELTETLWSHELSPWRHRIDMLGEHGRTYVTQAAWIRSLTATLVKRWQAQRVQIGGLFGGLMGDRNAVLPWTRPQQAAFLIACWTHLQKAIVEAEEAWMVALREDAEDDGTSSDPAFAGRHTLLNTDQGVRAVLYTVNDLCFLSADALSLRDWDSEDSLGGDNSSLAVSDALADFENQPVNAFLLSIMDTLATYDWRTAAAPGLTPQNVQLKGRFRGSSGYRQLRRDLLVHLEDDADDAVSETATLALDVLDLR